jgi:hypothetical protein
MVSNTGFAPLRHEVRFAYLDLKGMQAMSGCLLRFFHDLEETPAGRDS